MNLSSTSSSSAASVQVNPVGADLCALVCACSAGVHAALVIPHTGESAGMGVAFGIAAVALALAAAAQALLPGPATTIPVAALLLGVAVAYVLSRTTGIPGLTDHPEPFDTLGSVTSFVEVAAAVVAVRQPTPRRSS